MGGRTVRQEAIVYRQGPNWVANIGGYLRQLPYYVATKNEVVEYLDEYKVIFAK